MAHTCGTKSIAQYCYEDRDTETEQEPTRAATWRKTRYTNKKNGWVDQTSEEVYVSLKLNKLVNESTTWMLRQIDRVFEKCYQKKKDDNGAGAAEVAELFLRMMDECHNLQNSDQNPLLVSQSLLAPNVQQVRLVAACGRKRAEYLVRLQGLTQLLDHHNPTARAGPFCLALNGMALLVTLRPDPSPHVRLSPPETQEVGFANTTLGPSPSFYYADPGPGRLFGKPVPTARSRPGWPASGSGNSPVPWSKDLVGCGIYSTRSGTDVDDIITTSLFIPLGMLNATSPTGVTCAFVSLSVDMGEASYILSPKSSGFIFKRNGIVIAWKSSKQARIVDSNTEA
ncbi:UNVERIFIED_CONTAM: hypothetical protein Scaly_2751500 [Sesamum calycinum]|uniref:Uncharacterized protein n=1 Tax=Sesamum calycinum TaxID=2727403 RepID=A0AAW2J2T9_9LAMI